MEEKIYQGIYGDYKITKEDRNEVTKYRLAVFICGASFSLGMIQWFLFGPTYIWPWFISMAISLGLSLQWIHIYLRPLHNALRIFWFFGCIVITIISLNFGLNNLIIEISTNTFWAILIGPFFAALTGLGFKEFFCFRRPEAIGLTLLVPFGLIGHITNWINGQIVMTALILSAILLLIMASRKFGTDPAFDIGDKSVFEYLKNEETLTAN